MDFQLLCPLCNTQFSEQKPPRLLVMCGHSFCENCISTIVVSIDEDKFKITCPDDGIGCELTNNNLNQFPKNLTLLKVIQSNKSKSSFKDSSFDGTKISKQQQLQEDDDTKQLITVIKQSQQNDSNQNQESQATKDQEQIVNQQKQQSIKPQQQLSDIVHKQPSDDEENLCLLHQKPLEIVCIVDLQKICAKCAIFGEHKGHDFKSIQQIEEQNEIFNSNIIAIYNQKQEIVKRIENMVTKPDLLSILTVTKESFTKQIKQRFKKLLDLIKSQQKKVLGKLQKLIQKTEKDIQQLYKITPITLQRYQQWQQLSWQKLQISESGLFQQKLKLLLVQQVQVSNVIAQGRELIQSMKIQEDGIITKAEILLNGIGLKTSDKIFDQIQSYVEIGEKEEDKKLELRIPEIQKLEYKKSCEDDLLEDDKYIQNMIPNHQIKIELTNEENIKVEDIRMENNKVEDVRFVPVQGGFGGKKQTIQVQRLLEQEPGEKTSRDNSFIIQRPRPSKKKLKSIKVAEKYEKVLEQLYADTADTLDLTNAELGDHTVLQICQFIPGTKVKTVKFIRNKLTDEGLMKLLPYLSSVITLNLSQNLLTDKVLDIFIDHRQMMPKVKSIILSLNKINERKHKHKVDQLRKSEIIVSV